MAAPTKPKAKEQSSLFEACKNGDHERVKALINRDNVNSRDVAGRKSTPLHFAAGVLFIPALPCSFLLFPLSF